MAEKQCFREIDVERINVVDADGTVRMMIANRENLPKPVLGGKELERQGPALPGIIFFNDDGR